MTIVSYAQNFEDVRLWRAFRDIVCGRYLDIGTQDPVHDSVSLAFYERGWRGVHVEPTPVYAAAMRAARPDEIVIEAAVSTAPGPIRLYEIPSTGLSTGVAAIAERHAREGWECREISVPTVTLGGLFDHMGPDPIHWLKIDVEGMEADVLASWGNHPARPAALVIEATAPLTQDATHHDWHAMVTDRGYIEVLFDGLSRYFVHATHAHRSDALALAPNIFDGFQAGPTHFTTQLLVGRQQQALADIRAQSQADRQAEHETWAAERNDIAARHQAEIAMAEAATQAALADAARLAEQLVTDAELHAHSMAAVEAQLVSGDRVVAEQALAISAAGERLATAEATIAGLHESKLAFAHESGRLQGLLESAQQQAATLADEVGRLRDQIARRDRLLQQASVLLAAMPRPLPGWRAHLAVKVHARAIAGHQGAIARWQADSLLPPSAGVVQVADQTRAGSGPANSFGTHEGFADMESDAPITTVDRLLAPHDRQFIHTAYQSVLGRAPDPEGEAYYLARLRAGTHKLVILKQLRRSAEGRAFIPGVAGLDRAIRRQHRATLPVVGALMRLFTGMEGNGATHRQLRILANDLGRMRGEQAAYGKEQAELLGAIREFTSRLNTERDALDLQKRHGMKQEEQFSSGLGDATKYNGFSDIVLGKRASHILRHLAASMRTQHIQRAD